MKPKHPLQIILGVHSIQQALNNPKRQCLEVYATDEGLKNFIKSSKMTKQDISNKVKKIHILDQHHFQQQGMKHYGELGFEFQRITSGMYLLAKTLPEMTWADLLMKAKKNKIVALDHVTDIHNASAIIRTCAFYGVGALIIEMKGSFSISPSLTRIASGGLESVSLFLTNNLSATLKSLKKENVEIVGLSEEVADDLSELKTIGDKGAQICLVFGSEDRGISNAVERELDRNVSIRSAAGAGINSLNVSVAVAVTLDRMSQR